MSNDTRVHVPNNPTNISVAADLSADSGSCVRGHASVSCEAINASLFFLVSDLAQETQVSLSERLSEVRYH